MKQMDNVVENTRVTQSKQTERFSMIHAEIQTSLKTTETEKKSEKLFLKEKGQT